MSIFTTSLSQVCTADLQELLNDSAVENVRLEFKLEAPNKDETLKKLSSFANTFGGFMVVGARANSADGRIESLPGVDEQAGYKQKVVQWCFDGSSPPLTIEVSDPISTPAANGKVCYVVFVAESDVAPHFLNGRKGVWVRTDEFSSRFEAHLADEGELRHLLDRRRPILDRRINLLERARKRLDAYAAQAVESSGPRIELCFAPRFPARPLCEQAKLKPLIEKKQFYWRQVMFPILNRGVISQHESAIILQPTGVFSIFEANVWGMLFYSTKIHGNHGGTLGIHPFEVAGYVVLFIRHAAEMLHELGYSGQIVVEAILTSIQKAEWLDPTSGLGFHIRTGSELDDQATFSTEVTSESLCETPDSITSDLLRFIFFSVNWPNMVNTPEKLEKLIGWGYKFNE
jgi:schlafen family protein